MSYDDNNIFAKILKGEIPCKKIYENDFVLNTGATEMDRTLRVSVI